MDHLTAYEMGYAARLKGMDKDACPFDSDTCPWSCKRWLAGWTACSMRGR